MRARGGHLTPVRGSVVPTGKNGRDRSAVVVLRDVRMQRHMDSLERPESDS